MENPNCENGPDYPDDSEVVPAATCSLVGAEAGKQMAVLPYFTTAPLPVEVDECLRIYDGSRLKRHGMKVMKRTPKNSN